MDPITTISGPIDAASFNNDATAIGTKVLAEITQNTTKINEIVGGLTVVAGDLDVEEAARGAADSKLDVRMKAEEAATAANTAYHLFNNGYLQTTDLRLDNLEAATASGYVEVSSGNMTLANDSEHTINFTGTAGMQTLNLPTVMTDFSLGMNWHVVCNNADGIRVVPGSGWSHTSLTSVWNDVNLLVGDMIVVSVVDIGTTKKWHGVVVRGHGGIRTSAAGAGDLGGVDQDDRVIWVDRAADTGTRDLMLPALVADSEWNTGREITLILYGAPSSGTFVVSVFTASGDTFLGGAGTFTVPEKSVCRFIGHSALGKWAVHVGAGM